MSVNAENSHRPAEDPRENPPATPAKDDETSAPESGDKQPE